MNENLMKYLGETFGEVKKAFEVEGLKINEVKVTAPPRERPIEISDDLRVAKILGDVNEGYSLLLTRNMKTFK